MTGPLILDTSAFVALVDRAQHRHAECVHVLEGWTGQIATTEAVLTETLYMVGSDWQRQVPCFDFFFRGAFLLVPTSPVSLHRAAALMRRYQDMPMDYADATLVALAEELRTNRVFTLDRKGFSIYRLHRDHAIEVVP